MNEDILKRLNDLYANCIDIRGRNGQKIDIQLQKIIDDILEKEKTNKYHFYSATYPTHSEIVFVICVAGWDEGESEKIVYPLLGESWQIISEDTYSKNKEFSRENFQSAIVELNKLGFQYKGPIDDEAISWKEFDSEWISDRLMVLKLSDSGSFKTEEVKNANVAQLVEQRSLNWSILRETLNMNGVNSVNGTLK